MLQELSMVEQRYLAVREVLDTGADVKDVAIRYGVDRRTLHRWLVRYASGGLGALADRSSKPDRCPHQVSADVEARIVSLRRAHPGWGPRTILNRLRRELDEPPSRSAIYRALVRHGLIEPKRRRRRREDYRRWEVGVSRQTVQQWLRRYQDQGLASLADRSHRRFCPHQIAAEVEAQICELRRLHPGVGPRRIEYELRVASTDVERTAETE